MEVWQRAETSCKKIPRLNLSFLPSAAPALLNFTASQEIILHPQACWACSILSEGTRNPELCGLFNLFFSLGHNILTWACRVHHPDKLLSFSPSCAQEHTCVRKIKGAQDLKYGSEHPFNTAIETARKKHFTRDLQHGFFCYMRWGEKSAKKADHNLSLFVIYSSSWKMPLNRHFLCFFEHLNHHSPTKLSKSPRLHYQWLTKHSVRNPAATLNWQSIKMHGTNGTSKKFQGK